MKDIIELANNLKTKIKTWGGLTIEIVSGIYTARDLYNGKGNNQYSIVPNGTIQSFESFLKYIELPKRTAYNWLERYEPEKMKLLTDDELENKKQEENKRKQKEFEEQSKRVREYRQTGKKPEGWNERDDQARIKKEQGDADFEKRKTETFERRKKEFEERQTAKQEESKKHDVETENLLTGLHKMGEALQEKQRLLDKMRLTGNNAKEPIYDALFEYLIGLGESQRLEACHNIIKFCKTIASELQKESIK